MTPESPQDPRSLDPRERPGPWPDHRPPHGATAPPPAYQGIPQGIPPEPYENGSRRYQAFPGAYGPYGHVPPAGPRTNALAIISLVASIISCGLGSVIGVVCGHLALGQMRRTGEAGRGLAITGLVLGYLGLLAAAAVIALLVVGGVSSDDYSAFAYHAP